MADFAKFSINNHTYDVKDSVARGDISTLQTDVGDLQTDKEAVANKVTSIDSSSTDTEYPSAKAVYTLISNSDKFWEFTYGQPTYAEVAAKVNAGKIPWCYYNKIYYFLSWWDQIAATKYFVFGQSFYSGGMINAGIRLDETNTWTERTMISMTTINNTSTHLQTPTSKAVYDYVESVKSSLTLWAHNIVMTWTGTYISCRVWKPTTTLYTASTFTGYMANEVGPNIRIPAGGYIKNSLNETINIIQLSFNPYAYGGIGAYSAWGINEDALAWESVEFMESSISSFTDTLGG